MFVLPPILVFHYCHKKLKQAEAEVVQIYNLTFLEVRGLTEPKSRY